MAKLFGIHIGNISPSYQTFLSTGASTYYPTFAFSCSSFSVVPTSGATYTNNSATFTVTQVVGNYLYATSSGTPAAFGTLTKTGGTGDGTVTFSTYAQPKKIRVQAVAGGGGSAGSGQSGTAGNGGGGANTTFGGTLIVCNGANGATAGQSNGGTGGSATLGSGVIGYTVTGANGQGSSASNTSSVPPCGPQGGNSALGGGGAGSSFGGGNGTPGLANTGGGGGGPSPGSSGATELLTGAGGGAGGFANAVIDNLVSSYAISIATGGTVGTAGTSGVNGTAGGTGGIWIEESFNS